MAPLGVQYAPLAEISNRCFGHKFHSNGVHMNHPHQSVFVWLVRCLSVSFRPQGQKSDREEANAADLKKYMSRAYYPWTPRKVYLGKLSLQITNVFLNVYVDYPWTICGVKILMGLYAGDPSAGRSHHGFLLYYGFFTVSF